MLTVDPATNRLVGPAGTIQYDAAGNLTYDTATGAGARSYDAEGRMTGADGAGFWNQYAYDADGKRIRHKSFNAPEVWYVYGMDGELIAEYAANSAPSNPQKEYGYRNGELLVTAEGSGTVRWLVADHLGTPRMTVDQTGSLVNTKRHDYLPFGEELQAGTGGRTTAQGYSQQDGVRQGFTGYEKDGETGLNFAQARYHSPTQGRFTSPDPLLASANATSPQSWNCYSYCVNNPLKFTDPTGAIWGFQDYTVDGVKHRQFQWFDGDTVGEGFTAFQGSRYLFGDGTGVWLDPTSNNYQRFSQGGISDQDWQSMIATQESGGNFSEDQIGVIDRQRGRDIYRNNQFRIEFPATLIAGGVQSVALSAERGIALGFGRYLGSLADETGSLTYTQWRGAGLTNINWLTDFEGAFAQASSRTSRINFALDGIEFSPGARGVGFALERGAQGSALRNNVTNTELFKIYNDPKLFNKTQFFFENRPVSPLVRP